MTRKKKIFIVVLVLISIPLLLSLISVGSNFRKSIVAKGEIKGARRNAEKSADEKVAVAINILNESGVTINSLGSSKVDVCYVTHGDAGWFAANWYQDCYLRYVDGFTTNITEDEARQKLFANPKTVKYFGEVDTYSLGSRTSYCGLFVDKNFMKTLIYRPANLDSEDYTCEIPQPLQGVGTVHGPITSDNELSVKTFRTFDPSKVPSSQNQVWIMFDEHYYHEELGCGVSIIFCSNPRSKPAHPSI